MLMVVISRNVKDIDLYTGGLAETPVSGAVIGPTFLVNPANKLFNPTNLPQIMLCLISNPQCIVGKQFQELRDGDR